MNGARVPLTGRDVEPISCRERVKPHAIRPGGGCCAGSGAKIGLVMPGIAPETFIRGLHTGPSARTTSDSGVPAERNGRLRPG